MNFPSFLKTFSELFLFVRTMARIQKLHRSNNFEKVILHGEKIPIEEKEKSWRFLSFMMEAHFHMGNIDKSRNYFNRMTSLLIKQLDQGKITKQDFLWCLRYCIHEFKFEFDGVSKYVTEKDFDDIDNAGLLFKNRFNYVYV